MYKKSIIIVAIFLSVSAFTYNWTQILYLEIFAVVGTLLMGVLQIFRTGKVINIFSLVNILIFVFNLGICVSDIFGEKDTMFYNGMVRIHYSEDVVSYALSAIMLAVAAFNVGTLLIIKQKSNISFRQSKDRSLSEIVGKTIIIVATPLLLWKYYFELLYVLQNGYASMYLGLKVNIDYKIPFVGNAHILFALGYYGLLMSLPKKKTFINFSIIYVIVSALDAFKGSRGSLVFPLLSTLWAYYFFYSKKRDIKISTVIFFRTLRMVIFIWISLYGLQYAASKRMGYDFTRNKSIALEFLESQGNTLNVICLYIERKDKLYKNNTPYILSPVIFPYLYIRHQNILQRGQNVDAMKIRGSLNHSLSYNLNKNYYESGFGMGSSFIAEALEFKLIGVVVFSFLFGMGVSIFLVNINRPLLMYLSYPIIEHILKMPRSEYFINFWLLGKLLIMFIIFNLLVIIFKKIKNKHSLAKL